MRTCINTLVGVALLASMALPGSVFAQDEPGIYWGAWGRAIFSPATSNHDGETVPREMASWGWNSRIGFTMRGHSEKIGFHIDSNADSGGFGHQDQQKIWAKPFENMTVELGPNIFYDALRGNSAFGSWNWMRPNGIGGEDNIFARGQAGGGDGSGSRGSDAAGGFLVHLDTSKLHVFSAWNIIEDGKELSTDEDGNTTVEDFTTSSMIQRGQYGFGYDIEGMGQVRLQYIGNAYIKDSSSDSQEDYAVINGAVKLDQLVDGFYLDLGFFVPTDTDNTNGDRTKIAAYTNYKLTEKVTGHLLAEAELDKPDADGKEGTGIKVGAGAGVDIGNGYSADLDLRFHDEVAVATPDVDSQIAFLAGVKKSLGNGVIGIGVQGTTHDWGGGVVTKEKADDFAFAIPITLEYWF